MEEEIYILGATYWEVLDVRHAIDVMHLTKNFCVNLIAFLGVYGKTKDKNCNVWKNEMPYIHNSKIMDDNT